MNADKIKKIFTEEVNSLIDAVKNGNNPYHTFSLSTIKNDFPESRTIVLRKFISEPFKIFFNADYRSEKVAQLIENHNCTALFYDKDRRVQVRCKCIAKIHYNNDLSKKIWDDTALQSRKCYMGSFPPSQALQSWDPNIPKEYFKTDPEKKDSEKGYANFTHIELEIMEIDVLQLHHDGHIRFKVEHGNKYTYLAP